MDHRVSGERVYASNTEVNDAIPVGIFGYDTVLEVAMRMGFLEELSFGQGFLWHLPLNHPFARG